MDTVPSITPTRELSQRQLLALACKVDLLTFCRVVYPSFAAPPHIERIALALQQVARYIETAGADGIGRLRIELPPRHGKSQLVARLFPTFVMGRNPDLRIILASHGAQLSESHSRYVRNTIRGNAFASIFPRVRLAADSQARESWDLELPAQGGLLAVGTGGSVTGRGAGLIIADDLIKSREDYESATAREKLWQWWNDDLSTRKEPGAAIVSIGTRWGVDDVMGRLDLNEAGRWHTIRLPALAEENDPLSRPIGAALWPSRFNEAALNEQRESMGEYSFQALYQQNPVAAAGGIFQRDKFQIIENAPQGQMRQLARYWDLAISTKQTADYTVGVLLGELDGRYYVLDVARFRASWQDAMDKIAAVALADGPNVQIGIEQVLFSVAAVSDLLKRPDLHNFSIRGIPSDKDKVTRALPFAARVDAGNVSVLRRSWTYNFIDELCSFPGGAHDDQADSAAGAYSMLALVSSAAFVNAGMWDACFGDTSCEKKTVVCGVYGGAGDPLSIVGLTKRSDGATVRFAHIFEPSADGLIDYGAVEATLHAIAEDYIVLKYLYDENQHHDLAARMRKTGRMWWQAYPQSDRPMCDKFLQDNITAGRIVHGGHTKLREHILNADTESGKLRIVQRAGHLPTSGAIALSMAYFEARRLNI